MNLIKGKTYRMTYPDGSVGLAQFIDYENTYGLDTYNFEALPGEEVFSPHENREKLGKSDLWFPIPGAIISSIKFEEVGESESEDAKIRLEKIVQEIDEKINTMTISEITEELYQGIGLSVLINKATSLAKSIPDMEGELKDRYVKTLKAYASKIEEALASLD
jgi:hypothetical protein